MPHITLANSTIPGSSADLSFFYSWWRLTRALKAAGYRYKASSDGTTKDSTGDPFLDKWGGGVLVPGQTATVAFGIATRTTTAKGGRSTITGLTGMTSNSPGRRLTITGATNGANNGTFLVTKFISATSVEIENPNAIAETTPGTATWTERNSLTDTIPAISTGGWWNGEGPSTMRVPIGFTLPTGTFVRGENVTQTGSGATGEILGVMTDAVTGTGHIVIAPRKSGTGVGPRGWSTGLLTGSESGATVTPSATLNEFVREIVIWRGSTGFQGHIYAQVVDSQSESTPGALVGRFSLMATLGTCTAIIAPGGATGGAPSSNGFPTVGSFVIAGNAGPGAAATGMGRLFGGMSNTDFYGNNQIMCANNIEDVSISQDGSWILGISTAAPAYIGTAFQRCDDGEPGDVDPYVYWTGGGGNYDAAPSTFARTVKTLESGSVSSTFITAYTIANNYTPFLGWRRRGFPSDDAWQAYQGMTVGHQSGLIVLAQNAGAADRVATAPVVTTVRDPLVVLSAQFGKRQRKGSARWLHFVQGGSVADTYDGKLWIQLGAAIVPLVGGPYDGVTNPTTS